MTFTGIVLAGGASRRMGCDKALLEVDGLALAGHGRAVLIGAGAAETLSIGGNGPALALLGFDARPDEWPGDGPLGGLISGLEAASHPIAVAIACDLPRLSSPVVTELVARLEGSESEGVVPVVEGQRQPLAAAFRVSAAATLRARFEAGERSLRGGLAALALEELVWSGDPTPFLDVDTPEDLSLHDRHGSASEGRG